MVDNENIAKMKLPPHRAQSTIRARAENSENIIFGNHARERMDERGFTTTDVLRILRKGHIDDDPEPTDKNGEWKCKVKFNLKGKRTAGVVTIIMLNGTLFVKTVEWEDGQ